MVSFGAMEVKRLAFWPRKALNCDSSGQLIAVWRSHLIIGNETFKPLLGVNVMLEHSDEYNQFVKILPKYRYKSNWGLDGGVQGHKSLNKELHC